MRLVELLAARQVFLYLVKFFDAARDLAFVVFGVGLADRLQLLVKGRHHYLLLLSLVLVLSLLLDADVLSHGRRLHVLADRLLDGSNWRLWLLLGKFQQHGLVLLVLSVTTALELSERILVHVQVINLAELVLPAILAVKLCKVTIVV